MVFKDSVAVLLILAVCWISFESSDGYGSFGFDVHQRYSDTVKDFLDVEGLPEKDSFDYFAAMAHRDHLFKARRLATTPASSPFLTFLAGNKTYQLASLGFLHYSIVSVGTPALTFLVALDTGSDLFWLPCDCENCLRSLNTTSGTSLKLNIYSPSTSSTSSPVPCNSTMCDRRRVCALKRNACAYQEVYLSSNTSSTGILVDDVLALTTDEDPETQVKAPITLGCGISQTGDFIDGAAVNGLFGLGLDNISVPSILASKGLAANSFSMCFGPDEFGRIEFGDKGNPNQKTTPINVEALHPSYNVTVTQIVVGKNVNHVEFTAIFDSGTSFTYLNDPAYSVIAKSFDSQVNESRYQPARKIIFDYCYSLGATQKTFITPDMNFTFKGGDQFYVNVPIIVIPRQGGSIYCLAIVKSEDINIIGQNFMTGYRIVFDREEMVLGWSDSNCYDSPSGSNTLPVNKGNNGSDAPPPSVLDPVATPSSRNRTSISSPPPLRLPSGNGAARFSSTSNGLLMIIVSMLFHHFIILSS